jgi:CheY-like chemotaxis protein
MRNVSEKVTMISELLGMAVLVVEDNAFNQQLVKTLMSRAGVDVTLAGNGAEAIAQLRRYRFDAVLMDIQMPVMDGIETTRIIRDELKYTDLPVIAMTANAGPSDIQRYLAAGMTGTVAKPVSYQSLLDALVACVRYGEFAPHDREQTSTALTVDDTHFCPRVAIDRVGSEEVYLHMLDKFIPFYGQSVLKILCAISDSNLLEARRIAHTLKGAAATVGAPVLSDSARQMEFALAKQASRQYSELLEKLRRELSLVVTSIETYLETRDC